MEDDILPETVDCIRDILDDIPKLREKLAAARAAGTMDAERVDYHEAMLRRHEVQLRDTHARVRPAEAMTRIRDTNSLLDTRMYTEDGILYLEGVSPRTSERWVVSTKNGQSWMLAKGSDIKVLNQPGEGVYTRILDMLQLVKEGRDDEIRVHPEDQKHITVADEEYDVYRTLLDKLGPTAAGMWQYVRSRSRRESEETEQGPASE